MRNSLILIMMILAAGLAACEGTSKISDRNLESIEYEQLKEMIAQSNQKNRTILVDVRAPSQYREGFIPGAISIPLPELRPADPRLGEAKNIVVYGSDPGDNLTPAAAKRLQAIGYQNVYSFRGGTEMWQKLGGRLESATIEESRTK